MNSIVIFGAGNIGRSFIGSIFARNGWDVTFIDANSDLVSQINRAGEYIVEVKKHEAPDEIIVVQGVSAVDARDESEVIKRLSSCNICATSVGKGALRFVVPVIAKAVNVRIDAGESPLDIIIAENMRNGKDYFQEIFRSLGLNGNESGLVETSIGKMVPIMKAEDMGDDPLVLHAEAYSTLIVDAKGFVNGVPDLPEIKAVDTITAWVDRKLFIHNLGHAASSYLGYQSRPECALIADVLDDEQVLEKVRSVMQESAAALCMEYPEDLTLESLDHHIEDLLHRFRNRNLGDTVYRVGRDLMRKLHRTDRIVGAIALCLKHDTSCRSILEVFNAALCFRAGSPAGNLPDDKVFFERLEKHGAAWMIEHELGIGDEEHLLKEHLLKAL